MKKRRRVLETTRKITNIVLQHYTDAWDHKDKGKPIAWVTVFTPVELLHAMNVYPLAPEQFAALCGARGYILEYLEAAERGGYSRNICSYSRCVLGYVLSGASGGFPPPDILITFRNSCDVYVKWWQSIHMHTGIPLFIGETPYVISDDDLHNYVLDYVIKQLNKLISLLEERFNLKYDEEKLVEAVKLSDEASRLWLEILNYRKNKPCPLGGRDSASDIFPLVILQGTKMAVDFYQELLNEVKLKVRNKEGVIENEKFRLMFDGIWMWYAFNLIRYLEDRGAVFVYEPYSIAWAYRMDPENPLESIARKIIDMGLNVDVELRKKKFLVNIKDWSVDGAIIFSNRSCKTWSAPQVITVDMLTREYDIPCLVIEADHDDPRQYSEAQIKNRIDAFIEMLSERK